MVVAGQRQIDGRTMVEIVVRHAAYHCAAIQYLGNPRQVFAHTDTWERGGNRAKLAAHIQGSLRLGVPHVELAWPATSENDDHRFGAAPTGAADCDSASFACDLRASPDAAKPESVDKQSHARRVHAL